MAEFDEELHLQPVATPESESIAIANEGPERLHRGLESVPRFREVLVLRDLEGSGYKEIRVITSIPMGTVTSSLSRARRQLHSALANSCHQEVVREV